MAMLEYYVHLEAPSVSGGKFWIATISGAGVELHWGAVNTRGQKRNRPFGTSAAALKYVMAKETAKLSEGYREISRNRPQTTVVNASVKRSSPGRTTSSPSTPAIIVSSTQSLIYDF